MSAAPDLFAGLHAAIDKDERIALAVQDRSAPFDGQWVADGPNALRTYNGWVLAYNPARPFADGLTDYMAHFDKARALRRVAANRKMLDLHRPVSMFAYFCGTCGSSTAWPCPTVLTLAEEYEFAVADLA